MPEMITEIEDFFTLGCGRCERFATPDCSTRKWITGLNSLRRLLLGAGLVETVKWGHPCYTHAGRNIAIMGAFRGDFRLTFFNAALLSDPKGVLERQGPNTRHPDAVRMTDSAQVETHAAVILDLVAQAKVHAEAGTKAPRDISMPDLPEEMTEALDADPELAEAFAGLTPGRQKSYAIALASAKASATRHARIARFRPRILAGKGATEL